MNNEENKYTKRKTLVEFDVDYFIGEYANDLDHIWNEIQSTLVEPYGIMNNCSYEALCSFLLSKTGSEGKQLQHLGITLRPRPKITIRPPNVINVTTKKLSDDHVMI